MITIVKWFKWRDNGNTLVHAADTVERGRANFKSQEPWNGQ